MYKAGERVGAILCADAKKVKLLGYGVYEGDFEHSDLDGMLNPRIKLDSGETVWGCECWWDTEASMKAELEKFTSGGGVITNVSIDKIREEYTSRV